MPEARKPDEWWLWFLASLNRMLVVAEAYERSGLDVWPCSNCEKPVICFPDGMPLCKDCADAEEARQKGP